MPPQEKTTNFWKEMFQLVVLAVVIVVPFRLLIAQPFLVEGASMEPTFETGDYLIVDEISYRFKAPERGSVLVFEYPGDPSKHFIKRVIGLPKETVRIERGTVTIINDTNPEGFVLEEPYVEIKKDETISFTLKDGEYFVMGDNRLWSSDSRNWGPVPEDNIIGRPLLRFFPPDLFPGKTTFPVDEEVVNNNNP